MSPAQPAAASIAFLHFLEWSDSCWGLMATSGLTIISVLPSAISPEGDCFAELKFDSRGKRQSCHVPRRICVLLISLTFLTAAIERKAYISLTPLKANSTAPDRPIRETDNVLHKKESNLFRTNIRK